MTFRDGHHLPQPSRIPLLNSRGWGPVGTRVIGRCLACGHGVAEGERTVKTHGSLIHKRCSRYLPSP